MPAAAAPHKMAATTTAASAPGKVLLAGGYLVLDPKYTGLVFGLSARIHVVVKDVEDAAAAGDAQTKTAASHNEIVVDSPQFKDAQWRYSYEASETGGVSVKQVQGYVHGRLSVLVSLVPPIAPRLKMHRDARYT